MQQLLTIITTAVTTYIFTLAVPVVKQKWNAFKYAKKRTKTPDCALMEHNIEVLVEKVNELEEQMSNVAQNAYRRETNRKNNIRREVRDYLKELQK
jgi:hypothetical protein